MSYWALDDITVNDNSTHQDQIRGARQVYTMSDLWGMGVTDSSFYGFSNCGYAFHTYSAGQTKQRAIVATVAGSVTGISCRYDMTAATGTGCKVIVCVNENIVYSLSLGSTVASNQTGVATQARGIDTFSAGDTIGIYLQGETGSTATCDDLYLLIETYVDA